MRGWLYVIPRGRGRGRGVHAVKAMERASKDNLAIAREEIEMARSQKDIAAGLQKAAKIKNKLVKQQHDMARLQEVLALREVDMVKKKMAILARGILTFEGEDLDKELAASIVEAQFAKLQGDIARVNKKIGRLTLEIARERTTLAKRQVAVAEARMALGKAQQELVRLAGTAGETTGGAAGKASGDKIVSARKRVEILERAVKDAQSAAWVKKNEIRQKQDVLARLNTAMALKIEDVAARRAGTA